MRNVPGHEIWEDPEDVFWFVGQKLRSTVPIGPPRLTRCHVKLLKESLEMHK